MYYYWEHNKQLKHNKRIEKTIYFTYKNNKNFFLKILPELFYAFEWGSNSFSVSVPHFLSVSVPSLCSSFPLPLQIFSLRTDEARAGVADRPKVVSNLHSRILEASSWTGNKKKQNLVRPVLRTARGGLVLVEVN